MAANGSYPTSQYPQKSRQAPNQPPSAPRSSVPQIPGKDDLEKLENLKRIIKSGQHEFYRAIPQPEALAKLYMGVLPSSIPGDTEDGQKKSSANPEQIPATKQPDTSSTGPTSTTDSSKRPPRYLNKDSTDVTPQKPSISNGSSQNGFAAKGSSNVQPGQGLHDNGLAAAPNRAASHVDPNAMDVSSDNRTHDSTLGGASVSSGTPSTKPPGLPVKPDVPQPIIERPRADSTSGRLPASLPEKPSVDVRVGPGRPAPQSNNWQGRGDVSRPEIYDRPPAATQGTPGNGPPRMGSDNRSGPMSSEPYGQDSRDFRDRNRNWTERKPHDRYPRTSERPFDTQNPGPYVKTEEVPISLSDLEHRPSGPSDSFANGRDAREFPNEPMAATDSLQQPVPGLSANVDSQAHPAPLRRESYPPPQDPSSKTDLTDRALPPNDPSFGKLSQANGVPSDGAAQNLSNNERYPPRAVSPTVKQQPRDDVRGVPPKVGPSPNSNQARHSGPRDYNRGPNGENGPRPYRPPPNNYRPDYGDTRRTERMDVDEPRYMDRSYRPYSPPPDRARAIPPSPGRPGASDYDDPRRYGGVPPPPGSLGGRDWYGGAPPASGYAAQPQRWEDDPYYKSRSSHWDPSLERDRYERDPIRGSWDPRTDRDPRAYARGPPGAPPIDDRYPPRDLDRTARPLAPSGAPLPPYSRTRPRSPSPMRRGVGPMAVDDPRPPLKRSRDDYGPSHHAPSAPSGGADYYSPRNPDMRNRPPPPGSDMYSSAPPPSGPPPSSGGSGSFYDRSGPPPPSSSTMNSDRDRDYMRRDVGGMDYAPPPPGPPQHAGYGRPRSPPPPPGTRGPMGSASGPYDNRAPQYSRGPLPPSSNGRDRPYGMPPARP